MSLKICRDRITRMIIVDSVVVIFLCCKSPSTHPNADKLNNVRTEKIRLAQFIVHLKGRERLWLNYINSLLVGRTWEFRNAGKNDTTIIKDLPVEKLTHVWFQSVSSPGGKFTVIQRDFLVKPGEAVELRVAYNDIVFEGKSKNKKFLQQIIDLDKRVPSFKLKLHNNNLDSFNNYLRSVYADNIKKIKTAHDEGLLSDVEQNDFLQFNEVFVASEYLSPLTIKETDRDKLELHKINFDFAKQRLGTLTKLSSFFVPAYLSGFIEYNAFNEHQDGEGLKAFAVAKKQQLGKLYYPYLLKLITEYQKKNDPAFKQLIDSLQLIMEDSLYVHYLDSIKGIYFTRRSDAMQQKDFGKMVDVKGVPVTFSDALNRANGNVVVVDFWASWCGPCRREMPYLHEIRKRFTGQPVRFISISIDIEEYASDWLSAAKSEKIFGRDCYRLKGGNFNPLLKHYGIETVPRYMVFDKKGNLISDNFVDPTHKSFEEKLTTYLAE